MPRQWDRVNRPSLRMLSKANLKQFKDNQLWDVAALALALVANRAAQAVKHAK